MSETTPPPWRPGSRFEAMYREDVAAMNNFQDPSQEWRRLFSECFGTFLLVLVACGGGVMGHAFPNTISRTAAVTAPGLMVLGIILFMGKVSGAHLNPAVSIAFWLRGDFPAKRIPGYIVMQLIGASLGALFVQHVGQRLGQLWLELSGGRLLIDERHADGSRADARPGERDPRNGLGGPEPRGIRSARGRWLHHSGRPLG